MANNYRFICLLLFSFVFSLGSFFKSYFMQVGALSSWENSDGVIHVPSDYSSIREAVEHTTDGNTIIVDGGVYSESGIVVDKRVHIVGVDRSGVIVDGGGVSGSIIIISSSGVILENLTLSNTNLWTEGASAVTLNDVDGVVVKNVLISSVAVGVHIRDSNYSSIMYCDFSGISISGIKISGVSCNNTLIGNTFRDLPNKAVTIASPYSQFTRLYHNNFFNSSVPSPPATTFFDNGYPSGGNFWSDHVLVDSKHGSAQDEDGGDGIVDVGYPSDSPWDNYPLMFPILKVNVQANGEVFEVFISANVSVSFYEFDALSKELVFQVFTDGVTDCVVSIRVIVPKSLLGCASLSDWEVWMDGESLSFLAVEDSYLTYFYIVCVQSVSQSVLMFKGTYAVPEFSTFLPIFLVFGFLIALGIKVKYKLLSSFNGV